MIYDTVTPAPPVNTNSDQVRLLDQLRENERFDKPGEGISSYTEIVLRSLPEGIVMKDDGLHNFWETNPLLLGLPDKIEDYMTPEVLRAIMSAIFSDRLGKRLVSEIDISRGNGNVDGRDWELCDMYKKRQLPAAVFNLFVAHREWVQIHAKITIANLSLNDTLRRTMMWNICSTVNGITLTKPFDMQGGPLIWGENEIPVSCYDPSDAWLSTDVEKEGFVEVNTPRKKKKRRTHKRRNSFGYETDYNGTFEQKRESSSDESQEEEIHEKGKGDKVVRMPRLLKAYKYYAKALEESQMILNTILQIEGKVIRHLRDPVLAKAFLVEDPHTSMYPAAVGEKMDEFGQLLDRVDLLVRLMLEKVQHIIVTFDEQEDLLSQTDDCFRDRP